MSADNGIYILESLAHNGGHEYRVIHTQAIENIYWWPDGLNEKGRQKFERRKQICPEILIQYFGRCEVLNEQEASEKAGELYEHNMEDGGIVEYGISTIEYNDEFPRSVDLVD